MARSPGEPLKFRKHDPAALIYDLQQGKLCIYPQPLDIRSLAARARMALNLGVKW